MKNPYREILALVEALPEERRAFLMASARAPTTDTKRPCGCVFGQLYPPHRDERRVIVNYMTHFDKDEEFRAWAAGLGLDAAAVAVVQAVNDRFVVGATDAANTEVVARARYEHVRSQLEALAVQLDHGRRPSLADFPPVVLG